MVSTDEPSTESAVSSETAPPTGLDIKRLWDEHVSSEFQPFTFIDRASLRRVLQALTKAKTLCDDAENSGLAMTGWFRDLRSILGGEKD